MSADQPPIDRDPPAFDPSLSPCELLGSLTGEQLGEALVRSGAPLPTVRDRLSAHADDLERAMYAVRRLRERCGDDPAELRVNLLELREQLDQDRARPMRSWRHASDEQARARGHDARPKSPR